MTPDVSPPLSYKQLSGRVAGLLVATLLHCRHRKMVIKSVLDEDPPCLVVGGYARHRLSDEPHGQNLLALKFEMSH